MTCIPYAIRVHRFLAPKQGSERLECEDAIAFNPARMVFAISDGATEAYDSRTWARLLVKAWVRIDPPAFDSQDLEPLVRDLGRRLHGRWSQRELPWYAEEKAQEGSFAAFLALRLQVADETLHWRANALGDCCLIHRNGLTIWESFPIVRSEDFNSNPVLLPSIESKQRPALDRVKHVSGVAGPGHDFLLLSDAVAYWFLKEHERGDDHRIRLFDRLSETDDTDSLLHFFDDLRNSNQMRNDDIAILRIEIL